MLKATLTFVQRREPLTVPSALADLDSEDVDFLTRHIAKLRDEVNAESSLLTRFHGGSSLPELLKTLLEARDDEIVDISASLATRLQSSMDQSTNPSVGVLAVVVSGNGGDADCVSVLKLDAVNEAARYRIDGGAVKLSVLRDLLPAPGYLQKGLSWPDPRQGSQAIVVDRNQKAARYFFNAYELQVSATSVQAERALSETIFKLPRAKRAGAVKFASGLSGPAEQVVRKIQERYPELDADRPELGGGEAVGGFVRPNKVAARQMRYMADGIVISIPWDRLEQVSPPRPASGGWQMTVWFSTRPQEDTS